MWPYRFGTEITHLIEASDAAANCLIQLSLGGLFLSRACFCFTVSLDNAGEGPRRFFQSPPMP